MAKSPDAFVYNATLERIVDGDTFDCCLDLGFDVKLHKQRVRLAGIDTPESRTRDLAEKKLGLVAKARLKELQWMLAEQGNVQMLIWLGKQYLGQTDRPQESDVKPISEVVFDGI